VVKETLPSGTTKSGIRVRGLEKNQLPGFTRVKASRPQGESCPLTPSRAQTDQLERIQNSERAPRFLPMCRLPPTQVAPMRSLVGIRGFLRIASKRRRPARAAFPSMARWRVEMAWGRESVGPVRAPGGETPRQQISKPLTGLSGFPTCTFESVARDASAVSMIIRTPRLNSE
jgi:hypothetical protein